MEIPEADREILTRIAARDADALLALYERHGAGVLAHAKRTAHDAAQAEDVVTAAFLSVWSGAREFDLEKGSLAQWLPGADEANGSTASARVARRVMAAAGVERKRFGAAPFLAAALLLALFAVFYFSGRERDFAQLADRQDRELRGLSIDRTELRAAVAILNASDLATASDGEKARVFASAKEGILLVGNLPPLPEGRACAMWVIPHGGKDRAIAAGTFTRSADGSAVHIRRGAMDLSTSPEITVTIEAESGAQEPTSPAIVSARLQ